jgi:CubicO group peptidase (beta-lactamase class C family)
MRVASISKFVTAVGVMRLVEAGTLDLDRDVSLYLGYWVRNPNFPKATVTLRHLLTHTSTLTDGPGYVFGLGERVANSVVEPGRWDGAHEPGKFFRYSNYNFVLIGTIMEAATGERFDRLMDRLVLKPLAIEGCFNWAACADATAARAAALYRTGEDETKFDPEGVWVPQVDDLQGKRPDCPVYRADRSKPCELSGHVPGVNGGLFSPQGGLRISALGLAKVAQMLIRDGRGPTGPFLKPASVRALLTPGWRYAAEGDGETEKGTMCGYGLSAHVLGASANPSCRDDLFADGRVRAGHIGEAYGLYGGIWIDPGAKRASIYLVTGSAQAPSAVPGAHSAFTRMEEAAATTVR